MLSNFRSVLLRAPLPNLSFPSVCSGVPYVSQNSLTNPVLISFSPKRLFSSSPRTLYSSVQASFTQPKQINIHDSAVQRLKELQEKNKEPVYLRIEVEGGGCSGFQYKFRVDSQTGDDDLVFEKDGGRIVTDKVSFEFLQGATVEFEDSLMRSAFSISSNPNSEASCGCGSSFVAKMK